MIRPRSAAPDPRDIVREIVRRVPAPPSPPRTPYGAWLPYAEAVHSLVAAHGWTVADAVRHVIDANPAIADNPKAPTGVRAAYYAFASKNQTKP